MNFICTKFLLTIEEQHCSEDKDHINRRKNNSYANKMSDYIQLYKQEIKGKKRWHLYKSLISREANVVMTDSLYT